MNPLGSPQCQPQCSRNSLGNPKGFPKPRRESQRPIGDNPKILQTPTKVNFIQGSPNVSVHVKGSVMPSNFHKQIQKNGLNH